MSASVDLKLTVPGTSFTIRRDESIEDFGQSRAYGTNMARRILREVTEEAMSHLKTLDAIEDQRELKARFEADRV